MLRFVIRTGDGNNGCGYRESIQAPDWDMAIKMARERYCIAGEEYDEDGDADIVYLSLYETKDGRTAYNGGSYHIIEIAREDA